MLRYLYSFIFGTFLIIGICFEVPAQQGFPDLTKDPNKAPFIYDDVKNFIKAYNLFTVETDSLAILQAEYFDKGSPGLKEFVEKYQLNTDMLVKAIRKHPEKYGAILDMPELLSAYSSLTREEFVNKVAESRDKSFEEIEEVAQGRVWSGKDALDNGLVDVLGGLSTAINLAMDLSGLEDEEYDIVQYPPKPWFNFGQFLPSFLGIEEMIFKDDPFIEELKFRLDNNGYPMPIMPISDMDLLIED